MKPGMWKIFMNYKIIQRIITKQERRRIVREGKSEICCVFVGKISGKA